MNIDTTGFKIDTHGRILSRETSKRVSVHLVCLVLSLSFFMPGPAAAKSLFFSGQWFMNRDFVDLPQKGGPAPCFIGATHTGCVGDVRPKNGGITATGIVNAVGLAPAAFLIPPHAFQLGTNSAVAVPIVPTVVQVSTSFVFSGPADFTQALAAIPSFTNAQPAQFRVNAWSKDPGQAGRLAANFAWCPGVGGPACPAGTIATPIPVQGIVTYLAGPNAFGGTMAMITSGNASTSTIVGSITLPTGGVGTTMVPLIAHIPLFSGVVPQHPGASYVYTRIATSAHAPVYVGFMTSTGFGSGLITSVGPQLTTGGPAMSPVSVPPSVETQWGLPFTTGTISVMNTEMAGTVAETGTFTAMGSDSRNAAGIGRITLVAGGLTHHGTSGLDVNDLDIVVLNFSDPVPLPTMARSGLFVVALMIALTAGYRSRGRFARRR